MKKIKISLLGKVAIAIVLGIIFGQFLPDGVARIFVTFNTLFGSFLSFAIPLIILGLVAPAIGDLGKGAGRLLLITTVIAYGSTLASGFFTYFSMEAVLPYTITENTQLSVLDNPEDMMLSPFFSIAMPPLMDIMTALLLSFIIGLGLSVIKGSTLQNMFVDFRDVMIKLIEAAIIPLLPIHIFGIFLNITKSGQVASIMAIFIKVIIVIFILHILILLIEFFIGGAIGKKNPFRMLKTMLPAYTTALGTQSSAATIPVTHKQVLKLGVSEPVAAFYVPVGAAIHMPGSMMKITACAMAIMFMGGEPILFGSFSGFIFMLGILMIAAPGVPGGAIMASIGVLQSMLGFNETQNALMIALYIAMDSFGTACNVTVDGAIAVIMDKIFHRRDGARPVS
jgi:Na+/H+-dicarboxylate symporter